MACSRASGEGWTAHPVSADADGGGDVPSAEEGLPTVDRPARSNLGCCLSPASASAGDAPKCCYFLSSSLLLWYSVENDSPALTGEGYRLSSAHRSSFSDEADDRDHHCHKNYGNDEILHISRFAETANDDYGVWVHNLITSFLISI
jgi:hypothetical protein